MKKKTCYFQFCPNEIIDKEYYHGFPVKAKAVTQLQSWHLWSVTLLHYHYKSTVLLLLYVWEEVKNRIG